MWCKNFGKGKDTPLIHVNNFKDSYHWPQRFVPTVGGGEDKEVDIWFAVEERLFVIVDAADKELDIWFVEEVGNSEDNELDISFTVEEVWVSSVIVDAEGNEL